MPSRPNENALAWALLIARVGAGALLIYGHGWGKLMHFGERVHAFANPIGVGPEAGFTLVVFAEVFCAAAVALGLFTRFTVVPLLIFFAVAAFVQHAHDPFPKRELPMLFGIVYLVVALAGPGRFSIDGLRGRG